MSQPRTAWAIGAAAVGMLAWWTAAPGQQVHRNGFEGRAPLWLKGSADVAFEEKAHDIAGDTAHTGQGAEHWLLDVTGQGNFIYYHYPTGKAPVSDELSCSVWLKANRPGAQLQARLVLPRERQAQNLDEPLTTMLRGDYYQTAGRWQRLEIRRPVKLANEQQQLMRAELGRDVNFTDAYIDRLVLNLNAGPGSHEVWIDDLEVGPIVEPERTLPPMLPEVARPGGPPPAVPAVPRSNVVELNQDRLIVNGKRFFFRGIRHTNTPLKALRDAGFNTVWFDADADPARLQEAASLGLWVVPALTPAAAATPGVPGQLVRQFIDSDAVLFWDLGGGLIAEHSRTVEQAGRVIRTADPQRPLAADVWDGYLRYSRHVDLLGAHRWPLMTEMELTDYRNWLDQRRRLARPGTFLWTWVQTHLPDWYTQLVYERPASARFDEPIGPLPEQIRLMTYAALAAGSKGLGYWSDTYLGDNHQGRDRLLALALLNQEMQMLEPLLVSTVESPIWVDTSIAEVQAAVLRCEKGILVLPMWLGKGGQFVPGQSAAVRLSVVVPQVPHTATAWEITPADVRSLHMERVAGGTKVTLPEFGLTGAIVLTSDTSATGPIVRFQDLARRMRKLAAQWAHDLAAIEMEKVLKIETALEDAGHALPDGRALRQAAQERLKGSATQWNNGDYREAYWEAQRALRPLRILMRAQWNLAVKELDTPVASPYAVSYYTLPQHWRFLDEIKQLSPRPNVVTDGDFEHGPNDPPTAWTAQEITLDEVELSARRVKDDPKQGRQCLMLEVKPRTPNVRPAVLERTYLAIHSPVVQMDPGTLVRISGWIKVPRPVIGSPDGALLYDSAGGEPLGVRVGDAREWRQFMLYRRVPASGSIHVTVALTGLGTAYFDDIRIEPLVAGEAAPLPSPPSGPPPLLPASRRRLEKDKPGK